MELTFRGPLRMSNPTEKSMSKMKSRPSPKHGKDWNKGTSRNGWNITTHKSTKWSDHLYPNSLVRSRLNRSLKSLSEIRPRQGHLKLSRTWVIIALLLTTSIEGKRKSEGEGITSDVVQDTTNKHHPHASFHTSKWASWNPQVMIKDLEAILRTW